MESSSEGSASGLATLGPAGHAISAVVQESSAPTVTIATTPHGQAAYQARHGVLVPALASQPATSGGGPATPASPTPSAPTSSASSTRARKRSIVEVAAEAAAGALVREMSTATGPGASTTSENVPMRRGSSKVAPMQAWPMDEEVSGAGDALSGQSPDPGRAPEQSAGMDPGPSCVSSHAAANMRAPVSTFKCWEVTTHSLHLDTLALVRMLPALGFTVLAAASHLALRPRFHPDTEIAMVRPTRFTHDQTHTRKLKHAYTPING